MPVRWDTSVSYFWSLSLHRPRRRVEPPPLDFSHSGQNSLPEEYTSLFIQRYPLSFLSLRLVSLLPSGGVVRPDRRRAL